MTITVSGNTALNLLAASIANIQRVGTTQDVTVVYQDGSTQAFTSAWNGIAQNTSKYFTSTDGTYNLHNFVAAGQLAGHTAIAVPRDNVQVFAYDPSTKTCTYNMPGGNNTVQLNTDSYSYNVFPQ